MRYLVIFLFFNLFYSSIYAMPGGDVSKNKSEGFLVRDNEKSEGITAEDSTEALNNNGENDAAQFESDDEQANDPIKSNLEDLNSFEKNTLYLLFKMAISGFPSNSGNHYPIDSEERYTHTADDWARQLLGKVDTCANNDEEMENVMQMALILCSQQSISYNKNMYRREDIKKMLDQAFGSTKCYIRESPWLAQKKEKFSEKVNRIIEVFSQSIAKVEPEVTIMASALLAPFPGRS